MGHRRPLIDLIKAVREGDAWKLLEARAAAEKVVSRPIDTREAKEYPQPAGYSLYRMPNEVGGYQYWSDEIGGGVLIWDTCLAAASDLRASLAIEEQHGLPAQPLTPIPYDKLLCNASYLCYDPRRPGYVVGLWTDRWILLNHEMVLDPKVQRAARECLVPVLDITEEPDV